jgi:hypothetical protein
MTNEKEEIPIHAVGFGRHRVYQFFVYDEDQIKMIHSDYPERYILIQKQALLAVARAFDELGQQFTK